MTVSLLIIVNHSVFAIFFFVNTVQIENIDQPLNKKLVDLFWTKSCYLDNIISKHFFELGASHFTVITVLIFEETGSLTDYEKLILETTVIYIFLKYISAATVYVVFASSLVGVGKCIQYIVFGTISSTKPLVLDEKLRRRALEAWPPRKNLYKTRVISRLKR